MDKLHDVLVKEQGNGLIGRLFREVLSENIFTELRKSDSSRKYINNSDYFLKRWLNIEWFKFDPPEYKKWTAIAVDGKFVPNDSDAVKRFIDSEAGFNKRFTIELKRLKTAFTRINGSTFDEDKFLDGLVDALEKTKYYLKRPKDGIQTYDANAKERLINHINFDRELFDLPHFIRCYLYFAVYNSVPNDFSENEHTKEVLNEFSNSCLRKFGTTSKHGIMEIIRLATRKNKPNVIAICEYADILYYGQVEGIERDVCKAFQLYKKAAAIGKSNPHINAYPQAMWSVGHILFNYENTRVNLALSKHKPIPEIEKLDNLERIKFAYKMASQAYSISKLPAAANLLGQIAQLTDDDPDCVGINDFKDKKHMQKCEYYFNQAKDGGWVYAYNMLANEEIRQLTNEIDINEKWNDHINNYLQNLHEAAVRHEPWAANTLGRAYLEGIKYYDPASKKVKTIVDSEGVKTVDQNGVLTLHGSIDHFNIINPFNGQPEVVNSIIDPDRAFYYFMKAYEAYHVFSDRYCGWACANLKCYFSDRLSEEELRDIEAIIEKYSHIEPGILKTANEKRQLPATGYTKKLK